MRDRDRSKMIVRMIVFETCLMCLVKMVQSRTFYSQDTVSLKPVGYNLSNDRVKEYNFDEVEYENNPWSGSTALSMISNSANRFNQRQGPDDYGYGGYSRN